MLLSRKHPAYNVVKEETAFLEASYEGGEIYRNLQLLDRHPRELPLDYAARLERAYFANFVAAVVDAYVAEVFRRAPTRELSGERFEAFERDATLAGESLQETSREVLTRALSTDRAFVGLDLDEETGEPYAHLIHPENILDYSVDKRGLYNWALIAEAVTQDEDPEVMRKEERRTRLWTREDWTLYDAQGRALDSDVNASGVVPIVAVSGRTTRLPIRDIAETNRRLYNVDSQRDEILVRLTFPQFYMESVAPTDESGNTIDEDQVPVEIGTSRVLLLPPGTSNPPGFAAPPDGPVEQHRKEREALRAQIFELAGLQRQDPDTQVVQSGVAKAYDFRQTNARLANAATLCQRVEERLFELLKLFKVDGEANVTYVKDFDVEAFEAQLESYLKVADAPLPVEVKKMAAQEIAGRIAEERTQDERKEAENAVRRMTAADFGDGSQASASPSIADTLGLNGLNGFTGVSP